MSETNSKSLELDPEKSLVIAGTAQELRPSRPPIGLLLPTTVLLAFWIVTEAGYQMELWMFHRFISRMIALLVMLLFFLAWGFTRRHFTIGQRFLAFGLIVGTFVIAGLLGHPATGLFATAMIGLPIVISLSVFWLWLTRHRSARLELMGIGIASVAVFGNIALLRWDGVDGRQRTEVSWRWTPTAEQRFLQSESSKPVVTSMESRSVLEESAGDWSSFRGGEHESAVNEVQFADWSKKPPTELWRRRIGPGWSSVIAVDEYLFTQEQRGDQEAVVCYAANSGQEVWVHTAKDASERFEDSLSGAGPRATPTFHQNRIYAYGAKGRLSCLDAITGESYWSHALFEMTGASVPQWGASTSPTIVDDKVVVFVGGKEGKSVMAFDRLTGEVKWNAPGGAVSYSSPQIMMIAGERQIVMHDDAGISGFRIEDGHVLWTHASPNSASFQPMIQPHLVSEDQMILNWDAGIVCLKVQQTDGNWQVEEQWKSTRFKPSFNDFVVHGEYIYGLDDGILSCVDMAKGQRIWKRGRYGFGQLLLLPQINELLVLTETGDVVRVAADPKEHREIGRFKAIEGKTWNHPTLAHGRLIVRNSEEMACYAVVPSVVTAQTGSTLP